MEVAPCYSLLTLLTLFTLLTLIILLKLLYTATILACMPVYIVRIVYIQSMTLFSVIDRGQ